ncbi:hypothetical protein BZA70DRAFT_268708 [Myxozyma melibiosi]|uniref:DOCKER domain-containing protein n=1 Tax=Myxozyma melibiosi TaxID=54550 RepID=A0ABR1F1R8_9ASCO
MSLDWAPLHDPVLAVAKSAFSPAGIDALSSLSLRLGDTVYIFEQSSPSDPAFYRGYLLSSTTPSAKLSNRIRIFLGSFPASCVTITGPANCPLDQALILGSQPSQSLQLHFEDPSSASADPSALSSQSLPVIAEIESALHEWCPELTHALFSSPSRNYPKLNSIASLISDLCETRKCLLLDIYSAAERDSSIKSAVWLLVRGNKLLSGDVIVRAELDGRIRVGDYNLISLFRDQEIMALSTHGIAAFHTSRAASLEVSGKMELLHLLANFKLVIGSWHDGMFAKVYLCSKSRVLTESFVVNGGVLDQRALFVDLPPLVANDDIFLVVEIFETIYMTTQITGVDKVSKSYTIKARRGVGLGVVDIGRVMREVSETERDTTLRIFASSASSQAMDGIAKNGWGSLRDRLVRGVADGIERAGKIDKVIVGLRAFESSNSKSLTASMPSLFSGLSGNPRTLFTSSTTIPRDELYLTIGGMHFHWSDFSGRPMPELSNKALYFVTLSCNKESTLRFHGHAGTEPQDMWTSTVVSRDEKLSETVCLSPLARNAEILVRVHLADGKAIGQGKFPVWNEDVIIKDAKRSIRIADVNGLQVGVLEVDSCLVSSEFSSDETLNDLIRWRRMRNAKEDSRKAMISVLKQIRFVDPNEISKLLREALDSVFGIIAWKAGDLEFEDAAFAALAHILVTVEERNSRDRALLGEYIDGHFNYPNVLGPLIYGFQRLLAKHNIPDAGSNVRELLKVGGIILRFINSCWDKFQQRDSISIEMQNYMKAVADIFQQLCRIMEQSQVSLEASQISIMLHFPQYVSEVGSIFSGDKIFEMIILFVDASAKVGSVNPKLDMHRLVMLQDLSRLPMFAAGDAEIRRRLTVHTIEWLKLYIIPAGDEDVASLATWQAWKDKIRLSCAVLATQFGSLWPTREQNSEICSLYVQLLPAVTATFVSLQQERKSALIRAITAPKFRNEFSVLFPESYPIPPNRPVDTSIDKIPFDELAIELSCMLAALAEFATYESGGSSSSEALTEEQAIQLMSNVLKMVDSVLKGKAVPKSWLSVYLYMHRSVLSCLEFIAVLLTEYFAPDKDTGELPLDSRMIGIWHTFFERLIDLVGSTALEIEEISDQKRRTVEAICGDVREQGALLLSRMWAEIGNDASEQVRAMYGLETIGGYQKVFCTKRSSRGYGLVGRIAELWMSKSREVRAHAMGILKSMIVQEWHTKHSLDDLRSDIIDTLDRLFQNNARMLNPDTFALDEVIGSIKTAFPASSELGQEVHSLLGVVSRLLDLLLELHSLPEGDAYNDDRVLCTLSLMECLRDLHREETFVKYVHQLIRMQESSGHYAEAGLTLGLHAKMYPWRLGIELPPLPELELPSQSEFRRREALSLQMVRYFTLGNAPQLALQMYKELVTSYETISFELEKLHGTATAIAKLYKDEMSANAASRPQPQYFRVVYSGLGFHRALRGKQFIVQGSKWEKLADFTVRLQSLYPQAKIATAGSSNGSTTTNGNGVSSSSASNSNGNVNGNSTAAKHMSIASSFSMLSQTSSLEASLAVMNGEEEVEGQYLSIIAVAPEPSPALNAAVDIPPSARDFFLRLSLDRFSVSRPIKHGTVNGRPVSVSSANPVDVWVEKTVFATRERFPTILRRSEVVATEVIYLSPLASAAEAIARKAGEILQMARRSSAAPGDEMCSSQLGMLLSGAVDAPVNGGIQVYRNLLDLYESDQSPEIMEHKERTQLVLLDYVAVLMYALHVHSVVVVQALRPLHESLIVLFDRNFKHEIKLVEDEGRVIDALELRNGVRRAPEDGASRIGLTQLPALQPSATMTTIASSSRQNGYAAADMVKPPPASSKTTMSSVTTLNSAASQSAASLVSNPSRSSTAASPASPNGGHRRSHSIRNSEQQQQQQQQQQRKTVERKVSSVTLKSENSINSSAASTKSKSSTGSGHSSLASRMGMGGMSRRFSKIRLANGGSTVDGANGTSASAAAAAVTAAALAANGGANGGQGNLNGLGLTTKQGLGVFREE